MQDKRGAMISSHGPELRATQSERIHKGPKFADTQTLDNWTQMDSYVRTLRPNYT